MWYLVDSIVEYISYFTSTKKLFDDNGAVYSLHECVSNNDPIIPENLLYLHDS